MTQAKLPGFHTPEQICYPCFVAMRPALDAKGLPVWKCPKCLQEAPRKTEQARGACEGEKP